jgi:hypothetical protein
MKTIERRAVDIAATVMYRAGLCRYDSPVKCRKTEIPNECACIRCIEAWLLARAKKEAKIAQTSAEV